MQSGACCIWRLVHSRFASFRRLKFATPSAAGTPKRWPISLDENELTLLAVLTNQPAAYRCRCAGRLAPHCPLQNRAGRESGASKIAARLNQCGLELHPEKAKIAYCKDANRQETHPNEKFDSSRAHVSASESVLSEREDLL